MSSRPRFPLAVRFALMTFLGLAILYLNRNQDESTADPQAVEAPVAPPGRRVPGSVVPLPIEHAAAVPGVEDEDEVALNCLHQWWMRNPDLVGQITVRVEREEGAEIKAALLDYLDVPQATVGCLARAVMGRTWPDGVFEQSWNLEFPQ